MNGQQQQTQDKVADLSGLGLILEVVTQHLHAIMFIE
jgi:hypothetical protein